jgi:radical SAM protein with 4Fe4S-binding SPASM domain
METLRYSDFSLGLHEKLYSQRVPIGGEIEVTRRCPLRCVHCYNTLPMGDSTAKKNELTYKEHCRVIDQITEAGCLWLLYTGGEIFARKDFLDIYIYAKKKGLLITLFTSGIFLTPEIADHLAEWRPFSIEITLYGRTKETYERITGIPGSYEKCSKGIRLIMERGLPLKLKTMAITINKKEIWGMKDYVEKDLGLEFRFDALINPRIDCSRHPLDVRLTPKEVVEFDLLDPKRITELGKFCEKFNGPINSPDLAGKLYQCGGGMNSFAIDPYGMLRTCVLSGGDGYDLRKGNFRDGWETYLLGLRNKKITRQTKCIHCEIKAMCGMCPANAELENRDAEEPIDFMCQVAHLRAKALGIQVKPHGECEYCK